MEKVAGLMRKIIFTLPEFEYIWDGKLSVL